MEWCISAKIVSSRLGLICYYVGTHRPRLEGLIVAEVPTRLRKRNTDTNYVE